MSLHPCTPSTLIGLESKLIKLGAVNLNQSIMFIINLSIRTCTFPTKWKIGRVIPLHKRKGLHRQHPGSYRLITLLPVVIKVVERAIQEQVVGHMEKNQLFHQNQHAYWKGFSTESALLQLTDQLYEAAEGKNDRNCSIN